MTLPVESYTEEERERLAPHFTNLDRPVFGLVNLPETVKGALFARYSRYPGTLRRLFLDEFADSVPEVPAIEGAEGRRAADLYERIFLGYGDDSVAQLGGAHIACEWTSNLLTKLLQRPRLAAYLEQSTRYIAYDAQLDGFGYRYHRDPRFGPQYERALDDLFATYGRLLGDASAWVAERFPRGEGESRRRTRARCGRRRSTSSAGCCRPRRSRTSGSTRAARRTSSSSSICSRTRSPRRGRTATMLLEELQRIIPSFVVRVPREDRGGRWIEYLRERRDAADGAAARLGLDEASRCGRAVRAPAACARHGGGAARGAALRVGGDLRGGGAAAVVAGSAPAEREQLLRELVGTRENRRHRPGRGFETLRYRFEIVSDYGAFRDLQRHRLLTCQWQRLSRISAQTCRTSSCEAGLGGEYERALEVSRAEYDRLAGEGFVEEAPYALSLAFRIRYVLELDAREALHLIELRSGREGHPSYRAVAHEMRRVIAEVHPNVAAAMSFVDDSTEERLERLLSEMRNDAALTRATRSAGARPARRRACPRSCFVTTQVSPGSAGTAR